MGFSFGFFHSGSNDHPLAKKYRTPYFSRRMRWLYPIILCSLLIFGCYKGHWDGYSPQKPLEEYAMDACDCLKREVRHGGNDVKDLVERGTKLDGYRQNGLPDGISPAAAQAELDEFLKLRKKARESFRTFRDIPCVRQIMAKVEKNGGKFFDLGSIVADHCLLARIFTEMDGQ